MRRVGDTRLAAWGRAQDLRPAAAARVAVCAAACVFASAAWVAPVSAGEGGERAAETPLHRQVSVDFRGVTVEEALKETGKKAGVRFEHAEKMFEGADLVNYAAADVEAGRAAARILRPRGYRIGKLEGDRAYVEKLDPYDEFKVKREESYEFARKPEVSRDGDRVTIMFETKGFCDVTVAIEDPAVQVGGEPKIVRHLASGVLGENAPEPFQWNSRRQVLVWDGKDDQGKYVDEKDRLVVRVSLGLKPRFERTLFWSPHKRLSNGWGGANAPIMRAAPEGVYVYETGAFDRIAMFDHDGNYVRTVYPFPSDKLDHVVGLKKHTFPQDGQSLPLKAGFWQSTLLFGKNASPSPSRKYETGFGATAMAVLGGRIALVGKYIGRLATDGSSGGLELAGPKVQVPIILQGINADSAANKYFTTPCSAALSPDGKRLYLAGYMWRYPWHNDTLHGVTRLDFEKDGEPSLFAGSMKQGDAGTEEGRFRGAASVACDAKGRVYVADHCNDRIQVFDPEGKFLKAIPVFRPASISVSPGTGEIYVFSWVTPNRFTLKAHEERTKAHQPPLVIEPKLFRLGPFEDPKQLAAWPLPLPKFGGIYMEWWTLPPVPTVGEVDFWTDPPTIWISRATDESFRGEWQNIGILLLREKDGKLDVLRDFGKETVKTVARATPPTLDRQRLYANPKTGKLYIAEGDSGVCKSFRELVEIEPATGAVRLVQMPYAAEDMAFDADGMIYLRSDNTVVRYEFPSWREVPWDYGESRDNVAFDGGSPKVVSAMVMPSHRSPAFWHMGGVYINVKGHLAAACPNIVEKGKRVPGTESKGNVNADGAPYAPPLYPGRVRWGEIHVWDRHGKILFSDAVPGLGHTNGIGLDAQDNLYVMANGHRLINGKKYDPHLSDDLSETLMKFRPRAGRILSASKSAPEPLAGDSAPKRPPDFEGFPTGTSWAEGAEWLYGGVGYTGNAPWDGGGCRCWNARFCLDWFGRSFVPETRRFSVAALDSSGNLILRMGRYGNADEGRPLDAKGGPPNPRPIGGDEVAIFHGAYIGAHTNRRIFIADGGNRRILSVKLGYHAEEKVALKDVEDRGRRGR